MSSQAELKVVEKEGIEEQKQDAVAAKKQLDIDKSFKDISSIALLLVIIVFIVGAVLYFGMRQQVVGLQARVADLPEIRQSVDRLSVRMSITEVRLMELESLPLKAKKTIMGTMLHDMAKRTEYLTGQMETREQSEKLRQAQELLQQVQREMTVQLN